MKNIYNLAPVILFVYNRPDHTLRTLDALSENTLSKYSTLYIFCDGPKEDASEKQKNHIKKVRDIAKSKEWCGTVHIIESESNKGLSRSIIEGVNEIINKEGRAIILEDDLIVTNTFLDYMNTALERYEYSENVWQISGFGFSVPEFEKSKESYFLPISSTWGWATWKRVWSKLDFKCDDYVKLKTNKEEVYKFNFEGTYDYTRMFFIQMEKKDISSWGIRFYWNMFKHGGIVLYPENTLVVNAGWDSSGRHKDNYEIFPVKEWDPNLAINVFPDKPEIDDTKSLITRRYIKYRNSIWVKFINKLKIR